MSPEDLRSPARGGVSLSSPAMPLRPALLLIACLLAAPHASAQRPAGAETFQRELSRIARLVERGRYKAGLAAIRKLLRRHEGSDAARAKAAEIETLTRRCVFRIETPRPDLSSAVNGSVLAFDPSSRRIRLACTPDTAGDFELEDDLFVHPLAFASPFTFDLEGRFTDAGVAVVIQDGDHVFSISLDRRAGLVHVDGSKVEEHSFGPQPSLRPGRRFKVRVALGRRSLSVHLQGRAIGRISKPSGVFGRVGFRAGDWSRVVLSGRASGSWIRGRLDLALQNAFQRFARTWRRHEHLPDWLFEPGAAPPSEARERSPFPRDVASRHLSLLSEISAFHARGDFAGGLARLDELPPKALPLSARGYLRARFLLALERHREALTAVRAALAVQPDFLPARMLEAEGLCALGKLEAGARLWARIAVDHPRERRAYEEAARSFLLASRIEEAKEIAERALAASMGSALLGRINRTLERALGLPEWLRTYRRRTSHFLVLTDIDQATADEAARVLEACWRTWNLDLVRVRGRERLKVLIFSGEAGYLDWCRDVLGVLPRHTAGYYAPTLRQLLAWNLPERKDLLGTLRHEAFHHYLDLLNPDPPPWFDEGMAEDQEGAVLENGSLKTGIVRPRHLLRLRAEGEKPLQAFLRQDAETFYSGGEESYARAWALVHFLRHGPREAREVFRRLLAAVAAGRPSGEAVRAALEGVDPTTFERLFAAHLESLR